MYTSSTVMLSAAIRLARAPAASSSLIALPGNAPSIESERSTTEAFDERYPAFEREVFGTAGLMKFGGFSTLSASRERASRREILSSAREGPVSRKLQNLKVTNGDGNVLPVRRYPNILPLTWPPFSPIVEEQSKIEGPAVHCRARLNVVLQDLLPREVAGRQRTHIAMDRWK